MDSESVVVGMSGGVDSSVTALLLKEQGYNVIGMFMKNWQEEINGVCSSAQDSEDALRVCNQIGIPFYTVNFASEYKERVFAHFLAELEKGNTPNPDILCNREIKFNLLLETSRKLGAFAMATGHYAQNIKENGEHFLTKAKDQNKDQTYFLYTLNQSILKQVLFPIGHLLKSEVRAIAKKAKLPTAEKKDSTGICFIGKRDFSTFLEQFIAYRPGPLKTVDGATIGEHCGIAYYTIGQRHGLGIGGPGEPWFVVGKDVKENAVIVAQGTNHPALFGSMLEAQEISWVGTAPNAPFECTAKIRYRQQEQPCCIEMLSDTSARVRFYTPQRAITPQQSIVFYQGSHCLGGGIITGMTKAHR
jgi:tRNA-specific 2-thiouridylase